MIWMTAFSPLCTEWSVSKFSFSKHVPMFHDNRDVRFLCHVDDYEGGTSVWAEVNLTSILINETTATLDEINELNHVIIYGQTAFNSIDVEDPEILDEVVSTPEEAERVVDQRLPNLVRELEKKLDVLMENRGWFYGIIREMCSEWAEYQGLNTLPDSILEVWYLSNSKKQASVPLVWESSYANVLGEDVAVKYAWASDTTLKVRIPTWGLVEALLRGVFPPGGSHIINFEPQMSFTFTHKGTAVIGRDTLGKEVEKRLARYFTSMSPFSKGVIRDALVANPELLSRCPDDILAALYN